MAKSGAVWQKPSKVDFFKKQSAMLLAQLPRTRVPGVPSYSLTSGWVLTTTQGWDVSWVFWPQNPKYAHRQKLHVQENLQLPPVTHSCGVSSSMCLSQVCTNSLLKASGLSEMHCPFKTLAFCSSTRAWASDDQFPTWQISCWQFWSKALSSDQSGR